MLSSEDVHRDDIDKASENQASEPGIDVEVIEEVLLLAGLVLHTSNEAGHVRGDADEQSEHRNPVDRSMIE